MHTIWINAQATEMRSSRNEMASRLTAGDWVAYKSRGDPDQPFWIGKTLPKDEWGNQCIWKNDSHGVCVFLASGFGWGAVMHEIPISSPPSR